MDNETKLIILEYWIDNPDRIMEIPPELKEKVEENDMNNLIYEIELREQGKINASDIFNHAEKIRRKMKEKTETPKWHRSPEFYRGVAVTVLLFLLMTVGTDFYVYTRDYTVSKFGESKLTDSKLKEETIILYTDIMQFLKERSINGPSIDFNNWDESTNNMMKYSTETKGLYQEKFGARVVMIREEYLKRGIKSERLNAYYEHPVNPLVIEEIAYGLAELASGLNITSF